MNEETVTENHYIGLYKFLIEKQRLFGGLDTSLGSLYRGQVSSTGHIRNYRNIRQAHLKILPEGERMLSYLTLPKQFYSHFRRSFTIPCIGCNRRCKTIGNVNGCDDIKLPGCALHCSVGILHFAYVVEVSAMLYFEMISKPNARDAIQHAILSATRYEDYCHQYRRFLNKLRGKPNPPEDYQMLITPKLSIDQRILFWKHLEANIPSRTPPRSHSRPGETSAKRKRSETNITKPRKQKRVMRRKRKDTENEDYVPSSEDESEDDDYDNESASESESESESELLSEYDEESDDENSTFISPLPDSEYDSEIESNQSEAEECSTQSDEEEEWHFDRNPLPQRSSTNRSRVQSQSQLQLRPRPYYGGMDMSDDED